MHTLDSLRNNKMKLPNSEPFKIWPFEMAPLSIRMVSTSGGGEVWAAEVPPGHEPLPNFIEAIDAINQPKIYNHPYKDGWKIAIGSR